MSGGGVQAGASLGVVPDWAPPPPSSATGAELTSAVALHWVRGSFDMSETDVLDLVAELTDGGYGESFDYGHMMYKRHHVFVGGIRVYVEPRADNMRPVMVDVPGEGCEYLGHQKLQTLFCNAELSRVDVAFDGCPLSPLELAEHVRRGNIRCRAKRRKLHVGLSEGEGNMLESGSRSSMQYLRIYDRRGFNRVELEMKGESARSFKLALLAAPGEFLRLSVGMLRDFVDFVDAETDSNVSRAGLLPSWEAFTRGLARVRLRLAGSVAPTAERVVQYIEHQVAATLYTYHRLGFSVQELLRLGRGKLKSRHRSVLASAGVGGQALAT